VARTLKYDRVLFTTTLLLVCSSVVMVYSASALVALERYQQADRFVIKQVMWAVMGLAVMVVAMRVDYRAYRSDTFVWALIGLVSVTLVAVLFSSPVNGTRRWFGVGGLGIQPSEFAKLVCVLFTALVLERRMHRIDEPSYSLLPIGIVIGAMVGLILLQPDFGTALSLLLIVAVMIFSAGLHYRYFVGALLVMAPALYLYWSARRTAAVDCWPSGTHGRIRWVTVFRSFSH
jgi:cell division protein FtsW